MKTPANALPRKFARRTLGLALPLLASTAALAGAFLHNGAGTFEYTDTANWGGGVIGNNWNANVTADQTITFNQDYTTVVPAGGGSASIIINANTSAPAYTQTFVGVGGTRTLTLGGALNLTGASTNTTVTTFASSLNINLGSASRKFEAYANRVLNIEGVISGTGGISREWNGVVRLGNTANTFTGSVAFAGTGPGGVLEVAKLANGGQDSSLGKSDNQASRLTFGGSNSAGTLRYVGSGDSTDRRFTVGQVGAKFDASGTGALNWTNTAAITHNNPGTARTITFLGASEHANTMAAGLTDSGVGATSVKKEGAGRWILSGANTYTGATTIDAGTLELGSASSGGNGSNLVFNGGKLATGGFSETFGTLALNGNATIDFGSADSDLVFADSSAVGWGSSISLSLINFTAGVDSIRFGANSSALTGLQLGQITINGSAATIDSSGFLAAAIPEPSAFATLAGAAALLAVATRRRRAA